MSRTVGTSVTNYLLAHFPLLGCDFDALARLRVSPFAYIGKVSYLCKLKAVMLFNGKG